MAQQSLTLAEIVCTDFVKCPSCSDLYKQPLLLPCLHTLCQDCVVDAIVTEHTTSRSTSTAPCPASLSATKETNSKVKSTENQKAVSAATGQNKLIEKNLNMVLDMLTSAKDEVQLHMVCPICRANLTLMGNTSGIKNTDTDEDKSDDIRSKQSDNKSVAVSNGKSKNSKENGTESEKNSANSPAIKKLRALVRKSVAACLSVNYFTESVTQLHRYKNDNIRECQYCKSDGEKVKASSLCLDCQDDMCGDCANAHRKTRVTRDHKVAPYTSIQQGLYDHDIRLHDSIPCPHHPSNSVSHFCHDCLETACKQCRSSTHYGHNMTTLKEATPKLLPEIKQIQEALSRRVPALQTYTQFLQGHISQLETKKSLVVDEINTQADLVHKMIEEYRHLSISRLEQTCQEEKTNLQQKIGDLTTAAMSLGETAKFLLHVSQLGRQDEVLNIYRPVLDRHKQLVKSEPDAMTTRLASVFSPGPSTEQNIRILVGELDMHQVPLDKEDTPQTRLSISTLMPIVKRPPQVMLTFKAECPSDTSTVYPSGLALSRSMLAVVDRENSRIKIFDHGGKFLKAFSGEKDNKLLKPFDATFMKNGALAVTDSEAAAVRVFDWTGKFLTNFQGEIRHPRGIFANHKGEIIVLDGHLRHLTVHDSKTGDMIRKIRPSYTEREQDKDNDAPVCRSDVLIDPYYVTVTDDNNIVVTDIASPNLKIMNEHGLVLATSMDYGTREEESLHPSGLCVDKFGQILVADTNNSRVHLGLPNGQMPSVLVKQEDAISKPVSLAINEEGCLILAQSGGEISVLKYL